MIFWPRETATLLKSTLRYFHREKSTFEKFDAGLKLRIVFYTHKTIKNRRKKFRVIYTLKWFAKSRELVSSRVNRVRDRDDILLVVILQYSRNCLIFWIKIREINMITRIISIKGKKNKSLQSSKFQSSISGSWYYTQGYSTSTS